MNSIGVHIRHTEETVQKLLVAQILHRKYTNLMILEKDFFGTTNSVRYRIAHPKLPAPDWATIIKAQYKRRKDGLLTRPEMRIVPSSQLRLMCSPKFKTIQLQKFEGFDTDDQRVWDVLEEFEFTYD